MAKKTGAKNQPARELSNAELEARHYEVLGLPPFSSPEDVEKAYSDLAKTQHPDVGGDPDAFANATAAHQILSDPDQKQQYDDHLRTTTPTASGGRSTPEPTRQAQATTDAGPGDDVDTPSVGNPRGRNIQPPFTSNALYRRGERVRHRSFGAGQVTGMKQVSDGQVVYIAFEDRQSGSREIYNRFDGLMHL
jgi:curved DNA-binding protein CbpA